MCGIERSILVVAEEPHFPLPCNVKMKCRNERIKKRKNTAMNDSQRKTHLSRQISHELLLGLGAVMEVSTADHEKVHYIRGNISIKQDRHQV